MFEFSGAFPGGIIKIFHCSFPVIVFPSIFSLRLVIVTETRCWNPKKGTLCWIWSNKIVYHEVVSNKLGCTNTLFGVSYLCCIHVVAVSYLSYHVIIFQKFPMSLYCTHIHTHVRVCASLVISYLLCFLSLILGS